MTKETNWLFFGSSQFSVYVLDELKIHGLLPKLIITTPDKPKGRKLTLTPTPVKIWAQNNKIEVVEPATLRNNQALSSKLASYDSQVFLVASYGKIIPKEIFEIPSKKTLNIHPSLLPKYRGASPIQSQILNNEHEIGVTIMQIEETMDTGPVIIKKITPLAPFTLRRESKEKYNILSSPLSFGVGGGVLGRKELEKLLAIEGARLFAHVLPEWLTGAIDPIMQNEDEATYCKKIEKTDGELQIDLSDLKKNAEQNLLKIRAFEDWPTAYFFIEKGGKKIRVIVTDATLEKDPTPLHEAKLKILKVIPEGKKEMSFDDFMRGQK